MHKASFSVSAIVPVFNEAKTVTRVVEVLLENPLISEVICINDGSTDHSLLRLKKFKNKIKLISFKKNKGKGYALVAGIKKATSEIVTFIDADLINLSDKHLTTLLSPILEKEFKAVIGYPSNGWTPNIFTDLTGERAYYRNDLLPYLDEMATTKFGVEIFLNSLFSKKETKKLALKQLRGLYKYEKCNAADAVKGYLNEAIEIALAIGKREGLLKKDYQAISQLSKVANLKELKLRIKDIANKNVRQFLEKYVLNYAKILEEKWKNF